MLNYWLLKAEPDSRIVKGKDVKFSVDDFESVQTSPWEGVRSYEARNIMKEMKMNDKALFYHSNCKNPGVAAFAQVSKEAYPDYTAWDESHPYFDPKSDKASPKWFMVDLTFESRAKNLVPLALLKYLSTITSLPPELEYIGLDGLNAVKAMPLVTRGRLSVQRVDEDAFKIIQLLAEKGGWDDLNLKGKTKPAPKPTRKKDTADAESTPTTKRKAAPKIKAKSKRAASSEQDDAGETDSFQDPESGEEYGDEDSKSEFGGSSSRKKRKVTQATRSRSLRKASGR